MIPGFGGILEGVRIGSACYGVGEGMFILRSSYSRSAGMVSSTNACTHDMKFTGNGRNVVEPNPGLMITPPFHGFPSVCRDRTVGGTHARFQD
jgi:hypothetical protein